MPPTTITTTTKESTLHAELDRDVAPVARGKKALLWQRVLDDVGYEGPGVDNAVRKGADLVGHAPLAGLLPEDTQPPALGQEDL